MLDLRANGLAASTTRSGFVAGGASSTATRGYDEPRHLHRVARFTRDLHARLRPAQPSPAIRDKGAAASSAEAISSSLGFIWRRRRHRNYGMTGNPAASCANRFGCEARILRFRSTLALPPIRRSRRAIDHSPCNGLRAHRARRLRCTAISGWRALHRLLGNLINLGLWLG